MTTLHTPGPWFVNGPWNIQADTHTEIPVIVAHVTRLRSGNNHEREANARLIAAAPELLAAVKALLEYSPTVMAQPPYEPDGFQLAAQQARAALSKATGA